MRIMVPKVHTVVRHMGWGKEKDPNYPCDVLITGGAIYGLEGRISNHWCWRRITPDGRLLKREENGYGDFTNETRYEAEIVVRPKVGL